MGAGAAFAALAALLVPEPATAPPQPSIAIVEFPNGAPVIGLPARCPGAPPEPDEAEEAGGEMICFAELYQGWARVNRHLSGPRIPTGTLIRFTAHARNWRPGQRLLVATLPFRDGKVSGLFAYYWRTEEADGLYCVTTENLVTWDDNPVRRVFEEGIRRRFRPPSWNERAEFRCIRERRMLFER